MDASSLTTICEKCNALLMHLNMDEISTSNHYKHATSLYNSVMKHYVMKSMQCSNDCLNKHLIDTRYIVQYPAKDCDLSNLKATNNTLIISLHKLKERKQSDDPARTGLIYSSSYSLEQPQLSFPLFPPSRTPLQLV